MVRKWKVIITSCTYVICGHHQVVADTGRTHIKYQKKESDFICIVFLVTKKWQKNRELRTNQISDDQINL